MKLQSLILRNSLLVLALILALPAFRASAQSKPDAAQAQKKQSKSQRGFRPLPRNDAALESAQEGPEFLKRRQDWFFQPRAFPLGFIPQGARQRALQRMHQMLQNEGRLSTSIAPGIGFAPAGPTTSAWQFIGPQATSSAFPAPFTSGRVTALAVNPNNANNVYLGAADGGLWVTTDAGTIWTPLTDFPPSAGIASVAVGAIAVDPTTCSAGGICTTVYVGTGEDNFGGDNIYGEGVLKCLVAAGTPPTASCTQDSTFHTPSPLDQSRGGPLIGALAINPKTSGTTAILLAGVRGRGTALPSGIYCSANAGASWAAVFGISGIVGTDAVFASDGTAFVALGNPFGDANGNNGIYKSSVPVSSCTAVTDAANTTPGGPGSKWTKQTLPAGTPSASLGRIALAILPSSSSNGSNATVYAAIANATPTSPSLNLLGVVKTTNGGTAWTQLSGTPAFCNSQCFYDLVIKVDPADATGNTVFAGGGDSGTSNTLIRSTDGGSTWTEVAAAGSAAGLHVDTHALAFSANGSVLYVGDDGGVWSTTSPTAGTITWNNLNASLGITQFYPGISIHTSTPLSGLGGSQDNDLQQYQGPSLIWQAQNLFCDGGFTAIDPGIPSTIYGECEYVPGQAQFPLIAVAFNGQQLGNGFLMNTGINNSDRGSFIPPFVIDLKNPQTLYFGTCRVWQTKDGANTWNAISPDVTSSAHPAGCAGTTGASLTTIAPASSNSNTVYVGADNGEIEVTADSGTTWTSIVTATLPTRAVTEITVDPSNAAIAYATFSGFGTCAVGCTGPTGHVFRTVNGTAGAATVWTDIDGSGLPDIPVNAIVIDPDDLTHNTLYVGTDIGAFFTTTGGATWSVLGAANSLPPSEILGLALHNPSRTLRAATHGRGVWDLNLGGQAAFGITSIAPFTANAGDPTISNFTVNGNGFSPSSVVKFSVGGTTTTLVGTCATSTPCTATIPAAQLQNGALAQITVTDTGKTTNAVPFTVLNPVPGITSILPTTAVAGSSGLSLTVNGSNFLTGATLVLFNLIPLPANAVTVTNSTTLTVQVPAANLATPQTVSVDTFNPQPGGGFDINPTPPTLTITAATPSFMISASAVTPSPLAAGSSGMSTITLTPSGGFTSTGVAITCSTPPPGVHCSPLSIPVPNANPATGQLTVSVDAPSAQNATASAMPLEQQIYAAGVTPTRGGKGWWVLSAGTGLAALLLVLLPRRKRYRAALALALICAVSFAIGCSGGGGGGGGGPVATTTHITVTSATKAAAGATFTFTATVTGGMPTDQIQLLDGGAATGAAVAVAGGTATLTTSALSTVGTHTITAHYAGDATNTQASSSGPLNVTVTGTTAPITITGTSGSTTATTTITVTIN